VSKPIAVGVGAEQGLGRIASEGHHVRVAGHTPAKIERVAQAIGARGGSAGPQGLHIAHVATTATRLLSRVPDLAQQRGEGRFPLGVGPSREARWARRVVAIFVR
jgi:hypothetical protein